MIKLSASKNLNVLAIVPARKGSKGIFRKNIRSFGGTPLLAHSILTAKKSQYIDRIVVSTDDNAMRKIATDYGALAPFLRPKELGGDTVMDFPVVDHCLIWLKNHELYEPDIVVYLWPTGALRRIVDVDKAIELLVANPKADSVRTVSQASRSPYKMWRLGKKFMTPFVTLKGVKDSHHAPRQSLPKIYQSNPYALAVWTRTLRKHKSLIGKKVLPLVIHRPVVDIDTELDFVAAEWLLTNQPSE